MVKSGQNSPFYEFRSISSSLFDINGFMRSNTKSKVGYYLTSDKSIVRTTEAYGLMKNSKTEVVLQRVQWPRNGAFSKIFTCYAFHLGNVCRDYTGRVHVVFDGYLEASIKGHVHLKRYPVQSMGVVVNLDHKILCKKQCSSPIQ